MSVGPTRLACASVLALIASRASSAQELLHYKFDAACSDRAINYAANSPAPREAMLVTNFAGGTAAAWTAGRWGSALAGGTLSPTPATYAFVDTGWNPGTITGSMSWACWIKVDPNAPAPSLTYLFGTGSSLRVFTGGGGGFLLTSSWGGLPLGTTTDVLNLARGGWTHIALVLDDISGVARYYINGTPEAPIPLLSPVSWSGSAFYVGRHSSLAAPSIFDIDEFLLVRRAMTASEIARLASAPTAAVTPYASSGCGGLVFGSSGGAPSLGNASFALTLSSSYSAVYSISIGTDRCHFGPYALPLDVGTLVPQLSGCVLEANQNVGSATGLKSTGMFAIPLAIPNLASLSGATLYMQTAAVDNSAGSIVLSNALSMSIGQ